MLKAIEAYLVLRRATGFAMLNAEWLLKSFAAVAAERGKTRIARAFGTPMHRPRLVARDRDRTAQAIEGEALGQCLGDIGFAVEQHVLAVRPDDEVEERLALRGQQPGPYGQRAAHIIGDETLEEAANVRAGQADQCAIGEGGAGHNRQLGAGSWAGNGRDCRFGRPMRPRPGSAATRGGSPALPVRGRPAARCRAAGASRRPVRPARPSGSAWCRSNWD